MKTAPPEFTPETPLSEAFELYARRALRSRSEITTRHYRLQLSYFDRYLGRPATLADLDDETVQDAIYGLMKERGWSPYTANKFRGNVVALWRWLARKRHVDEFPDVERLRQPKRIPQAWSKDDLAKLWAACDKQTGFIATVPRRLWWHTLHAVLWDSAERIGAVLSLRREDVDLQSCIVIFRAEHRKGGRSDSAVRIHPDTAASLAQVMDHWKGEVVFPWPYSRDYLWQRYRKILEAAGLPNDRNSKFHRLRRSSASWFAAVGGDASDLLRHSSPAMARDHYIDPRIASPAKQEAADVLFRIEQEPLPESAPASEMTLAAPEMIPSDWKFETDGFCYRGQRCRAGKIGTAILRTLVEAGEPITLRECFRLAGMEDRYHYDRAFDNLRHLRKILRERFRCGDEWEPIPKCGIASVTNGLPQFYSVNFPPPGADGKEAS